MQSAPQPENEQERLAALYELDLLDTPLEERFDRITRLATSGFGVSTAYVALVDTNRQWFKSQCGVHMPGTDRASSFCAYTILGDDGLIIPDAAADQRFSDNPNVTGPPHIRFYAGWPLRCSGNLKVGTLCLVDPNPRDFGSKERDSLRDLAAMVEDQMKFAEVITLQKELLLARQALADANSQLEVRNQFLRNAFGCFLSDSVAAALLERPQGLELGGESRTLTILMADLRDFTSTCERIGPKKAVAMLNRYLGTMTEIIHQHGGTIDEFIGDAILVFFGAPLTRDDDAKRALACAVDMQLAMATLNEGNCAEGLPHLDMGIGVNTGEVIVGNIGSPKRMKYGSVGSPVNLTARIQDFTLGGQILASAATLEAAGEGVQVSGKLRVKVKGVSNAITIYDVTGMDTLFHSPHTQVPWAFKASKNSRNDSRT